MTENQLIQAHQHFVQGMSRISSFWGFPRAMGAIYGAVYLSPAALSLDEIVTQVGVTKGAVSTHVRQLERLGMLHRHIQLGDRKDYYTAETDFWKIVRGILQEREKNEFDLALNTVGESIELAAQEKEERELADFYKQRMQAMQGFFKTLDSLVAAALAFEGLVSLSTFKGLMEKAAKK